jgi:hypothetical protein
MFFAFLRETSGAPLLSQQARDTGDLVEAVPVTLEKRLDRKADY